MIKFGLGKHDYIAILYCLNWHKTLRYSFVFVELPVYIMVQSHPNVEMPFPEPVVHLRE